MQAIKGTFVDGHERPDVVSFRKKFLRRMVGLGFINNDNAPSEEARRAFPDDIDCPGSDVLDKSCYFS